LAHLECVGELDVWPDIAKGPPPGDLLKIDTAAANNLAGPELLAYDEASCAPIADHVRPAEHEIIIVLVTVAHAADDEVIGAGREFIVWHHYDPIHIAGGTHVDLCGPLGGQQHRRN